MEPLPASICRSAAVVSAFLAVASGHLQLFMDPSSDLADSWGLISPNPTALVRDDALTMPPENYTAGATVFASFNTSTPTLSSYEIFVAVGRPGEPITSENMRNRRQTGPGVAVKRYTTEDFKTWSNPVTVLFLPNGPSNGQLGDGNIWTVKSMDRNSTGYLLIAYYGDLAASFFSPLSLSENSFKETQPDGSFKDHDDTNLIYSRSTKKWVDMQIFSAPFLLPNGSATICPHNLTDNGGCKGPRVVTVRTSENGITFSGDYGCNDPKPTDPVDPSVRRDCKDWNEEQLIRPHPSEDPPEMQFYRMRPFYVGDSGRLAAHVLQYAASPAEVNNISSYGYWGPYCPNAAGGFDMCHKGHGYGKMHGPHMMEEWWVSNANQSGPEDLAGWERPFKRFRAVPHDVWLMSQPIVYDQRHVWVADTGVYTLPIYRISGVYAPANGEFTTEQFQVPATGLGSLWLNADISWHGGLVTGGCDEGCAAYVMVALLDQGGNTIPGYERSNCVLMNTSGVELPIQWTGSPAPPAVGSIVKLRIYFRDATIYAFGI